MADYYELLGVGRDASKEEIRKAYQDRRDAIGEPSTEIERSEIAQLNDAWQTLADPYQRGRHDAALEVGATSDDIEVVDEEADAPRPRRRGMFAPPPEAEAGRNAAPAKPTIEMPPGAVLADNRSRINAMVFDLALIMLMFVTGQIVGQQVIEGRYPEEVDALESLADAIDYVDDEIDRRDLLEDRISGLETQIVDAEAAGESTDDLEAQVADERAALVDPALDPQSAVVALRERLAGDELDADDRPIVEAEIEDRLELVAISGEDLDVRRDALDGDADDILADLAPAQLVSFAAAVVVGLAYLVGFSLGSGRTLGKRLRRIRVVRADGSPLRFSSALVRYAIPALVTSLTLQFLGFLGFALGLLVVLAWMRNPNKQGLHDRVAKTIVIEG